MEREKPYQIPPRHNNSESETSKELVSLLHENPNQILCGIADLLDEENLTYFESEVINMGGLTMTYLEDISDDKAPTFIAMLRGYINPESPERKEELRKQMIDFIKRNSVA